MNQLRRHIVLLRGVMPTGKNKVPMQQLREVLSQANFTNVRTWISTGNVLLDTDLSSGMLAAEVRNLIREHIGPDLVVIVTNVEQIQAMLDQQPFEQAQPDRVFYTFVEAEADPDRIEDVLETDFGENEIAQAPHGFYLHVPESMARSSLSNNRLEKLLGVSATTRNRNTLTKLVELGGT